VNRILAIRVLERRGHTVLVAENGCEALEILARERVDVILMDIQMPEMDGFQATAAIREKEKTSGGRVPIVALTANAMRAMGSAVWPRVWTRIWPNPFASPTWTVCWVRSWRPLRRVCNAQARAFAGGHP